MKKYIAILFIMATSFAFGQKVVNQTVKQEKKSVSSEIRTPTLEEINKEANALTQEDKNKMKNVSKSTKKLGDNSETAMALYTLEYTKNEIIEKVKKVDKTMSDKDYVAWLNDRLTDYKNALKEADEISRSKVNFTENDKSIVNEYKVYYQETIPKFEAEISRQKK